MWAKIENNEITETFKHPKGITIGDTQYPHNIFSLWSEAELNAIGIYSITTDITNLKDPEYYQNTDITYTYASNTVTGDYGEATAKNLADLKKNKKGNINSTADALLSEYDWYTLRAASGGTAIPSVVTTYQAAVRTKSNTMSTAIDDASDVDALAALYVYNSDDPPVRPLGEWPNKPEI